MALQNYYYIYEDAKPKRDAILLAEKQITDFEEEITKKTGALGELKEQLLVLKNDYHNREKYIKNLSQEIDDCSVKKSRAVKLLDSLISEKQKWNILNKVTSQMILSLEGDALLAAGTLIYLGQMTYEHEDSHREKYFE